MASPRTRCSRSMLGAPDPSISRRCRSERRSLIHTCTRQTVTSRRHFRRGRARISSVRRAHAGDRSTLGDMADQGTQHGPRTSRSPVTPSGHLVLWIRQLIQTVTRLVFRGGPTQPVWSASAPLSTASCGPIRVPGSKSHVLIGSGGCDAAGHHTLC